MRNYIFLLIFSCIFCGVSCSCSNPVTNDGLGDALWKASIVDKGYVDGEMRSVLYKNGVLFLGARSGQSALYMLDKTDGKLLWKWSDLIRNSEIISAYSYHQFDNVLVFENGSHNYAINLDNGQTLWRTQGDRSGDSYVSGIGTTYFFAIGNPLDHAGSSSIYRGNIYTGTETEVVRFNPTTDGGTLAKTPTPFITQNGDTVLVIRLHRGVARGDTSQLRLVLYNLTKQQIVYDRLQRTANQLDGNADLLVVNNNRIYDAIGRSIVCNDLQTGEQLWRQEFSSAFLFSGLCLADGKIFAACEDVSLYALDAKYGSILWQKRNITGTTRTPVYLNGVVYIASGGDGHFYAVDAANGDIIWKKESPEVKANSGAFFFGPINGADGKIYLQNYQSAFCYKAAR